MRNNAGQFHWLAPTGSLVLAATLWLAPAPCAQSQSPADPEPDKSAQLASDQARLAEQYKLLEEKLFSLHEFERDNNPDRSELLQRAYQLSKQQLTLSQMQTIVSRLQAQQLSEAQTRQEQVVAELQALLDLLQSEDRSARIKDDIQRYQDYLKEVERILRIQNSLRGQAESGRDPQRLGKSQGDAADRTGRLAEQVRRDEQDQSAPPAGDAPPAGQQNPPEDGPDSSAPNTDGPPQPQVPPPKQDGDRSQTPSPQANPVQQNLQQAQQRMQQAQSRLEQAQRDNAVEQMREAERELAEAKKELEEILRQLREEEVGRTLAMLESRFRQMLQQQIDVYESTTRLDRAPTEQRTAEFEIQAGKLSILENAIATEASRALMLLQEDGSSIAFPETVEQMHADMLQVAHRLSAVEVGPVTQEIEQDIIDTLQFMIEALVHAQDQLDQPPPDSPNQPPAQAGEQALVDQLAELKMLRGLQDRIFRRHQRYAQLLADPNDRVGQAEDPELQQALLRLSERQLRLQQITRDIVAGKNQ